MHVKWYIRNINCTISAQINCRDGQLPELHPRDYPYIYDCLQRIPGPSIG